MKNSIQQLFEFGLVKKYSECRNSSSIIDFYTHKITKDGLNLFVEIALKHIILKPRKEERVL